MLELCREKKQNDAAEKLKFSIKDFFFFCTVWKHTINKTYFVHNNADDNNNASNLTHDNTLT